MFRFESKEYLHLLSFIPLILFLGWVSYRIHKKRISKVFGSHVWNFLSSSLSVPKRRFKWTLEISACVLFVVALARPQLGTSLQEVKSEGVEIVIAFDVSTSMMAEDIKPSRLDLAKSEVKRLLATLSGDKVGLVVFAGSSFLMSPLTTDYSALSMYVESLTPDSVSSQGTLIKPALEEAIEAFKRGGAEQDENTVATRVVLIVSDGEDHEEGALQVARKMRNEGMRIYTMGVGTEQGGPIPVRDDLGYMRGYKKDETGNQITTVHRGEFMRKLASAGGGQYFYVIGGGNHVESFKREVDRLEKAQFETQMATEYDERFQVPLLLGFLLALIELFLGERKKTLLTRKDFEGARS